MRLVRNELFVDDLFDNCDDGAPGVCNGITGVGTGFKYRDAGEVMSVLVGLNHNIQWSASHAHSSLSSTGTSWEKVTGMLHCPSSPCPPNLPGRP